jgi:SAM-dependent methyltransferase
LTRLASERSILRVVGIDLSAQALARLREKLEEAPADMRGKVDLVHGSFTEAGETLTGFDAAVLVETIEHIDPDRLSVLERAVYREMRPATVLITTPNREFNPLLGVPSHRFRHPDHRFEWGRAKFRSWAAGVARRNGYSASCRDIAGAHPDHGGASQMALFDRETGGHAGSLQPAASATVQSNGTPGVRPVYNVASDVEKPTGRPHVLLEI